MSQPKRHLAPLVICLMIGIFILFLIWSWHQATTHSSRIIDKDYYSKGLKYNDTLIEKRAAKTLGWSVKADLDDRLLQLQLRDGEQHLVSGASGKLRLARRTAKAEDYILKEETPGTYLLQLPEKLQGELRVEIEFEQDGALLTRQLLLNL